MSSPKKRGEGTSCHHCKKRILPNQMLKCTRGEIVPTNSRKRKRPCVKKYCLHCIKTFYSNQYLDDNSSGSFICPACRDECRCAACRRRVMKARLKNDGSALENEADGQANSILESQTPDATNIEEGQVNGLLEILDSRPDVQDIIRRGMAMDFADDNAKILYVGHLIDQALTRPDVLALYYASSHGRANNCRIKTEQNVTTPPPNHSSNNDLPPETPSITTTTNNGNNHNDSPSNNTNSSSSSSSTSPTTHGRSKRKRRNHRNQIRDESENDDDVDVDMNNNRNGHSNSNSTSPTNNHSSSSSRKHRKKKTRHNKQSNNNNDNNNNNIDPPTPVKTEPNHSHSQQTMSNNIQQQHTKNGHHNNNGMILNGISAPQPATISLSGGNHMGFVNFPPPIAGPHLSGINPIPPINLPFPTQPPNGKNGGIPAIPSMIPINNAALPMPHPTPSHIPPIPHNPHNIHNTHNSSPAQSSSHSTGQSESDNDSRTISSNNQQPPNHYAQQLNGVTNGNNNMFPMNVTPSVMMGGPPLASM